MAVHVVGCGAIGLTVVGLVEDRPDPFEERVVVVIIIFYIIDDWDVVYLFQYPSLVLVDNFSAIWEHHTFTSFSVTCGDVPLATDSFNFFSTARRVEFSVNPPKQLSKD